MPEWAPCRGLDDVSAFKASEKALPQWSLGAKLPTQADLQKALPTEPAARGALVKEVEATKIPYAPSYTMGTREAGILPPPQQPGPGTYPIASTVAAAHPADVQTARAFCFSASKTERSDLGGGPTIGPGPLKYGQKNIASAPVLRNAPSWTAAGRANDPDLSVKEKRPGCQTYVVKGLLRDGPIFCTRLVTGRAPFRSVEHSRQVARPGQVQTRAGGEWQEG